MQRTFGYVALITAYLPLGIAFGEDNSLPTPQDVIRKAIEARGGKKKLAAFAKLRVRGKGEIFYAEKGTPVTTMHLHSAPESYKVIMEIKSPESGIERETMVFNGKDLWIKQNGITREGTEDELFAARMAAYSAYVGRLCHLLDNEEFTLATLPASRINGKGTAGVRVSSRGRPDIDLYFDKKTWLLVKEQYRITDDPMAVQEVYYEKYKRHKGGIMWATRKKMVINGTKRAEFEMMDLEPLTEVEAAEFSKP
jgi:hypothetical protein